MTELAQRVVPLAGGRNFRDLGGYATQDGRRLRWGRLYRSGVMSYFTDADRARLSQIGLRTICDFRSPYERRREPTNWHSSDVQSLHWDYDFRNLSFRAELRGARDFTPAVLHDCMLSLYRKFPVLFAKPYSDLFARLAAGELPLVFHCSAGKDRTGIAAALVLTSLGVPREAVFEDYALTDRVVDLEKELFQHPDSSIGVGDEHAHLARIGREARAPILRAMPEYLRAAFEAIETDHGSVAAYLKTQLGVSEPMLASIRQHLLEG
jgi:protein-tyrosine phosphatase